METIRNYFNDLPKWETKIFHVFKNRFKNYDLSVTFADKKEADNFCDELNQLLKAVKEGRVRID